MARNRRANASLLLWLFFSLHILFFMASAYAKSGRPITLNLRKDKDSNHYVDATTGVNLFFVFGPIGDAEIRMKKDECYADIESGLWGLDCKASMIAKENCALRCLSPRCYELVYESDPLEGGEKDFIRGQEFKYCMYRVSTGESLDGIKGSLG